MNLHDYFYNHPDKELSKQWVEHVRGNAKLRVENHILRTHENYWKLICLLLACALGFFSSDSTSHNVYFL